MSLGDWLDLNVGGRSFLTTRSTLTSCPDSALARMFDPNSGLRPAYSRNGVYFLDVDPDCFSVILNWLRRRMLMLNPGVDINGVRREADFFGLMKLCKAIDVRMAAVEGTWVNRGAVVQAMMVHHGNGQNDIMPQSNTTYVFSRTGGNRLELVPFADRQETVSVDAENNDVVWVEMTIGNVPRRAIKVGEGDHMFIGKKHNPDLLVMSVGYVTEDGEFRRAFACTCNKPDTSSGKIYNRYAYKAVNITYDPTPDDRFLVLCAK